jgi:hypothetical protein
MTDHREKAIEIRDSILSKVNMSYPHANILAVLMCQEIQKNALMPLYWEEVLKQAKKL